MDNISSLFFSMAHCTVKALLQQLCFMYGTSTSFLDCSTYNIALLTITVAVESNTEKSIAILDN